MYPITHHSFKDALTEYELRFYKHFLEKDLPNLIEEDNQCYTIDVKELCQLLNIENDESQIEQTLLEKRFILKRDDREMTIPVFYAVQIDDDILSLYPNPILIRELEQIMPQMN